MRPEGTRTWRKTRRRALRGIPTGRRATHAVETTYGQRQQRRDHEARMSEVFAALRAERAAQQEAA